MGVVNYHNWEKGGVDGLLRDEKGRGFELACA